jgi:hypothetical protein
MHDSKRGCLIASIAAIALNLFTAQNAAAKDDAGAFLGLAHFFAYGKAVTGREEGYTFGVDLRLPWGGTEFTAAGRQGTVGITTEMAFGLGNMHDDADELRLRYDVNCDLFGIAGGYQLTDDISIGAIYNPINLYSSPNIAFLGAKFELHAAYKFIEAAVARSGAGYGYGFIVPSEDMEALNTDLRFRTRLGTFGVRYLMETPRHEDTNKSYMIFWGAG